MPYANYSYYLDCYNGSMISASDFSYYAKRATAYIKSHVKDIDAETAAQACCALSEAIFKYEDKSTNISSEKVGDYSVTYKSENQSTLEDRLADVLKLYINPIGWC
ncbi:MAG: hypothetical protein Q4D35_03065 [Ruminococcus sp.]|nr:hypothetical protein [Ruminococcus sp.]